MNCKVLEIAEVCLEIWEECSEVQEKKKTDEIMYEIKLDIWFWIAQREM